MQKVLPSLCRARLSTPCCAYFDLSLVLLITALRQKKMQQLYRSSDRPFDQSASALITTDYCRAEPAPSVPIEAQVASLHSSAAPHPKMPRSHVRLRSTFAPTCAETCHLSCATFLATSWARRFDAIADIVTPPQYNIKNLRISPQWL